MINDSYRIWCAVWRLHQHRAYSRFAPHSHFCENLKYHHIKANLKCILCNLSRSPRGGSSDILHSLTSALDKGGCSKPRPGRFTLYPLYRRLGGPQGRSRWVTEISSAPGFDPRTVLDVANCYADCVIPAHKTK